jgi:hypothetical protein
MVSNYELFSLPCHNVDIQLTILAFDLYVDRNQFNDARYRE